MANNFTKVGIPVGTALTAVYTCPAGATAVIFRMTLSNTSASNITANVVLNIDTPSSSIYMGRDLPVPKGSTLSFADSAIVLNEGDSIEVSSSALNSLDVYCSVLEMS